MGTKQKIIGNPLFMQNLGRLLKPTIQITVTSVIGIIINFLTQLIIAYYFGTKFERDAYFVAIAIPTYIISVFTSSFGYTFLPKVVDIIEKKEEFLNEFVNSLILILFCILLLITILGINFCQNILRITSSGFNKEQIEYSSKLLVIIFPSIIFSTLTNFLSSLYQIKHLFLRPAVVPILSSIISLIFVLLFNNLIGIKSLAYGSLAGSFCSFLMLFPVIKYFFKKNWTFSFKNVDIQYLFKISFPLFLSGIILKISGVIERMIASGLPEGSISYLGYANQILTVLSAVTIGGISTTIYPMLSKAWTDNNIILVRNSIEKYIRVILLFSLYISAVFIFFGQPIIRFIFERGSFNHQSTLAVSKALSYLMGVFIFSSLGSIISKSFYIKGKTLLAFFIGITEIIVYLFTAFFLSKYYAYIGLAASLMVSSAVSIIITSIILHYKLVRLNFKEILLFSFKILVSITFSLSLSFILRTNLNPFFDLIFTLFISSFFYLIFIIFMFKIPEVKFIKDYCINLSKKF